MKESAPYLELQEGSTDSNADGRAYGLAEPNGFEVEDPRGVLVRVGLLLLTVTEVSTTCEVVIFRVKASCIT